MTWLAWSLVSIAIGGIVAIAVCVAPKGDEHVEGARRLADSPVTDDDLMDVAYAAGVASVPERPAEPEPDEPRPQCPAYSTLGERCELAAGHPAQGHVWEQELAAAAPAPEPAASSYVPPATVELGGTTVHQRCADARRDGNSSYICHDCAPVLFGAAATLPRRSPGYVPADDVTYAARPCQVCGGLMRVGMVHHCGPGEDLRRERVA